MGLPSAEEQAHLLDALAGLVRATGPASLLTSHLAEANAEFFPGEWASSAEGMRFIAMRLLALAGLGDLDARVVVGRALDADLAPLAGTAGRTESRHRGAAAWFEGIEDGVCLFGVDETKLEDPAGALAAMAHEVAHAWRHAHRLAADTETEELLTDVTTVYLGFGILTTNGAYRYRAGGAVGVTRWSHTFQGYLAPESMAFLLAAQLVARGAGAGEVKRVGRLLEANQAAAFASAHKSLQRAREGLASRLDLPPVASLPPQRPLADLFARVPEFSAPARARAIVAAPAPPRPRPDNRGLRTFRVRHTSTGAGLFLGLLAGGAAAIIAGLALHLFGSVLALLLLIGACAGFLLGRRRHRFQCADPQCEAALSVADARCPECAARVDGELASANDRLAANDALDGVADEDGVVPAFPTRKRGGPLAKLMLVVIVGLGALLAVDAHAQLFANDVRIYFSPGAAAQSLSIDGAPVPINTPGVLKLKLRMGTRVLNFSDAAGVRKTLALEILPGSAHAVRASNQTCFTAIGALRFYTHPGARFVDTIIRRLDQDAFELPAGFYFEDTLPEAVPSKDTGRMAVIYDCDCIDLGWSDSDLAARVWSSHH